MDFVVECGATQSYCSLFVGTPDETEVRVVGDLGLLAKIITVMYLCSSYLGGEVGGGTRFFGELNLCGHARVG